MTALPLTAIYHRTVRELDEEINAEIRAELLASRPDGTAAQQRREA